MARRRSRSALALLALAAVLRADAQAAERSSAAIIAAPAATGQVRRQCQEAECNAHAHAMQQRVMTASPLQDAVGALRGAARSTNASVRRERAMRRHHSCSPGHTAAARRTCVTETGGILAARLARRRWRRPSRWRPQTRAASRITTTSRMRSKRCRRKAPPSSSSSSAWGAARVAAAESAACALPGSKHAGACAHRITRLGATALTLCSSCIAQLHDPRARGRHAASEPVHIHRLRHVDAHAHRHTVRRRPARVVVRFSVADGHYGRLASGGRADCQRAHCADVRRCAVPHPVALRPSPGAAAQHLKLFDGRRPRLGVGGGLLRLAGGIHPGPRRRHANGRRRRDARLHRLRAGRRRAAAAPERLVLRLRGQRGDLRGRRDLRGMHHRPGGGSLQV